MDGYYDIHKYTHIHIKKNKEAGNPISKLANDFKQSDLTGKTKVKCNFKLN